MRAASTSLLSGDFTVSELRLIAKELMSSEVSYQVHLLIEDYCYNLDNMYPAKPRRRETSEVENDLFELVKRRRVSKQKFANAANQVVRNLIREDERNELSLQEMVEHFQKRADQNDEDQLIEILGLPIGGDPFLKGIMRR